MWALLNNENTKQLFQNSVNMLFVLILISIDNPKDTRIHYK
jgi:hypothetical protein